jgi:Response regulator with putative antiterminator output domain
MAGERYVIATAENNFQITIRNILNPRGYTFLDHCRDAAVLMRLIRSYCPDFVIIDLGSQIRDIRGIMEAIDDELICTCILIGEETEIYNCDVIDKSRVLSYCYKGRERETLVYAVEIGILNYKRVSRLEKKLKEMTESFETRKSVDKAKWILMNRHNIAENEAYQRIRKKSMDTRLTMRAIADAIICTYEIEKG